MDITIEEVKEAFFYFKNNKYPELRIEQIKEDGYYRQDYEPFPDDLKVDGKPRFFKHRVRPPRGRRIVDGPADWLAMDQIVVHIPPKTNAKGEESKKAIAEANLNELWGQALLDYEAMRQPYYVRSLAVQLPKRGENWLKIETDWDYVIKTKKGDEYEGIPFRWVVPDSLNMMATTDLDDYSRPEMTFETKVHTASHVKKLIKEWNPKKNTKFPLDVKDYQDVYLVEWCTAKFRGYIVGDGGSEEKQWYAIPIDGFLKVPNLNGVVPYIRGYSSLGDTPNDGDLRKLVVGFLRPVGNTIIQEARDLTKLDQWGNFWVASPGVWTTDGDPSNDPNAADLEITYGKVLKAIKGKKEFSYLPVPDIPPAIHNQIRLNQQMFEDYDPSILRGTGQSGETAVGQSQRVGLGLSKWEPLKITLKQVIANAMSTTFQIVEKMDVPVKLNEKVLNKEKIGGYYKCSIDIKPGNPEAQTRDLLLYKQLKDILPREWAVEKLLHVENAPEFLRQSDVGLIIWQELNTPGSVLRTKFLADVIKANNLEDELAEANKQVSSGGGATQGTPIPEGPVQGANQALGESGISTQPPVPQPQSQVNLQRAQEGLAGLG